MEWYFSVWQKYADFDGRARRKEFFMFYIIQNIFMMIAYSSAQTMFSIGLDDFGIIIIDFIRLFVVISILPSIAVTVRRLHDTNNAWWVLLIPFSAIIFIFSEGDRWENKYGPDPKSTVQIPPAVSPGGDIKSNKQI